MHRAVIAQHAANLPQNQRHGVGGKFHFVFRIKSIDRLDQPHAAPLKQIVVFRAAIAKPPQRVMHQRQIFMHQRVPRIRISRAGAQQKRPRAFVIYRAQARCARSMPRTSSCFSSRTVVPLPTSDLTSTPSIKLSITVKPMPLRSSPSSVV